MQSSSLFFLLKSLWNELARKRKLQFLSLAVLSLVSAVADVFSLGALIPFLGIIANPQKMASQTLVAKIMMTLNIESPAELILPFTVFFSVTAIVAGLIRIILLKYNTKFAFSCGADLSFEVYKRTLYQTYKVHLESNSSRVISGIINKVNTTVFEVFFPLLNLFSNLILVVVISTTLFLINPLAAIFAAVGFCTCYLAVTFFFRRQLIVNSRVIADEQTKVVKVIQESLGGIRDVLMDGAQSFFSNIYKVSDRKLRLAQGNNIFIGQSPRHAMEAFGIALIALLALSISRNEGLETSLPVLGALALGAQRLLPSIQYCYSAWVSVIGNKALLFETVKLLHQPVSSQFLEAKTNRIEFNEKIKFNSIRFGYSNTKPLVLDGISFEIKKGNKVGIVGATGCGKTTLLDVFMGLLSPIEGAIEVDNLSIDSSNVSSWQRNIAHVAQNVYLADSTFAENIAFGISKNDIDIDRVKYAAHQANISEFIESSVGGYWGFVGEGGARLSGGQRQRIGIARALYKESKILVLDEATSSLDSATEKSVMESVNKLDDNLTVIIIAHRISTIKGCDFIVELGGGRILSIGTYDELMLSSKSFQALALAVDAME